MITEQLKDEFRKKFTEQGLDYDLICLAIKLELENGKINNPKYGNFA